MHYGSLFLYHFTYFIINGLNAFLPKYYGEIGMSDSHIGMLMSLPTVAAMAVMPVLGALSDRVPRKRYLLAAELAVAAVICVIIAQLRSFLGLLIGVTAFTACTVSLSPLATSITLEYCAEHRRPYGPVRLLGTIGYQAASVIVGAFMAQNLQSLYPLMAGAALASFGVTFLMPNVEGHQHSKQKVPIRKLFEDRHICWLLGMILFGTITTQFHMSFFSKHLGDLGMDNRAVSAITLLAVLPELPFLFWGDRIMKKLSVWNWLLIALCLNGLRWIAQAVCTDFAPILIIQLLGLSVLACFEFAPALYLSRRVPPELQGSAQSLLNVTAFGVGRVIGGLLGGFICEKTGIPAVYAFNGVMLLVGCVLLWKPTRRLIRAEADE